MAAAFNSLLAICLVFSTFSSCAKESNPAIEDDAYTIALQQYQSAKLALEQAVTRCESGRQSVPAEKISPLGLTSEQMKVALYTLNARAEARCEKGLREQFFYTASVYRMTAKHYGRDPGDAVQYNEEEMLSHLWRQLEFEAKYLRIDKEVRSALENMEALQVPFKIFETLDNLDR
jgi:hypothetical protein